MTQHHGSKLTAVPDVASLTPLDVPRPGSIDDIMQRQSAPKPTAEPEGVEITGDGGRQSPSDGRFDLIPLSGIFAMARIVQSGALRHGERNWASIPVRIHVGRAVRHLLQYLSGDRNEPHLENAFTRVAMAIELSTQSGE